MAARVSRGVSSRRGLAAGARARPSVRAAAAGAEAATEAARLLAVAPTMYALVSANEYATHRWYQHRELEQVGWWKQATKAITGAERKTPLNGGGHVEHHAETLDDMSLKVDATWLASAPAKTLEGDTYRGTAFEYPITAVMWLQMLPTSLPVLALEGFDGVQSLAIITAAVAVHGLVWNSLHPAMHGLPEVPGDVGLPSQLLAPLRDSAYYRWLYQNHEGHHVAGRCNFNVCCPGMDHLLGTYVPESEWRARANLPARESPRPQYDEGEYSRLLAEFEATQEAGKVAEPVVTAA